jgi:hypothetical protein
MTFWQWLQQNWVKTLSSIGSLNSALIAATASGMFTGLLPDTSIKWLALGGFFMNAWLVGVGFNNTTKERVASALETAIKAQPPAQGGFVRPLVLALLLAIAVPAVLAMQGCATNPDGSRELTPEGQAILETSTRIAVRHYVADSPRAAERVQNLREVVAKLQELTSAETTLGALKAVVVLEVERLNLAPLDKADALDLLDLFAAALESRLGQDPLQATGLVRVNEFLSLVLAAIPEVQLAT